MNAWCSRRGENCGIFSWDFWQIIKCTRDFMIKMNALIFFIFVNILRILMAFKLYAKYFAAQFNIIMACRLCARNSVSFFIQIVDHLYVCRSCDFCVCTGRYAIGVHCSAKYCVHSNDLPKLNTTESWNVREIIAIRSGICKHQFEIFKLSEDLNHVRRCSIKYELHTIGGEVVWEIVK